MVEIPWSHLDLTALLSIFYVECLGLSGFYVSVMVEIMLAEYRTVKTRCILNLHGNSSYFLVFCCKLVVKLFRNQHTGLNIFKTASSPVELTTKGKVSVLSVFLIAVNSGQHCILY